MYRLILTGLWWAWGLLLIVVMIGLSRNPALFADPKAAWDWFLPNLLPTLTLVGASAYAGGLNPAKLQAGEGLFFTLCLLVSAIYLGALSVSILGTQTSSAPLDSLRGANTYLGPLQGLVTSLLGFFFVKPAAGSKSGQQAEAKPADT